MDQFGVLVESIGFKPQGKSSAPLADLKATNKTNPRPFPPDTQSNSNTSFFVDDLDGIFRSNPPNSSDVFSVFRAPLTSSNNYNHNSNSSNNNNVVDDVFGLMNSAPDDVIGNKVSPVKNTNPIDDLLGNFGVVKQQPISSNFDHYLNSNVMKSNNSADLLSNFGNGRKTEGNLGAKSFSASAQDPFVMFETTQWTSSSSYNGGSVVVDDDYLDSLFSQSNSQNPPATQDSVYDALFSNTNVAAPKQQKKESLKQPKPNSIDDDFSYLFGMGVSPPSSGQFQEIDGESEERRKARFNHHITTRERMNNALREKNKRDQQAQREQDEKHRVATTLDGQIKHWAVGKEGNLRALLSSLQYVLWDGSGWQAISLTDLITSTAVKKAYYKATLCVHPDKVQQKGSSVEQKYIAEKVFDLLKEAWNKFNAEEFKKQ